MQVVGFLQNAWSPLYAGLQWPRDRWLAALYYSRSGQRLRNLGEYYDQIWWDNTTPIVGATPDPIIKPDHKHIEKILDQQSATHVITFGVQAAKALTELWDGPHIIAPHPTYRVVKNELFHKIREVLDSGWDNKITIKQTREKVEVCLT